MKIDTTFFQLNTAIVFINFGNIAYKVGKIGFANRSTSFQYDEQFLELNLNISPLNLRFTSEVQYFTSYDLQFLPGVFYDSLPDGWGLLLQDRFLNRFSFSGNEINSIQRLLLREKMLLVHSSMNRKSRLKKRILLSNLIIFTLNRMKYLKVIQVN